MIKKIWNWITDVIGTAGMFIAIFLIAILTIALTILMIFVTLGAFAAPIILSMLAWKWIFG